MTILGYYKQLNSNLIPGTYFDLDIHIDQQMRIDINSSIL